MEKLCCDFLVAGGGIAGMCAAVAAARKGLQVILINDRSVLGGNASSEIGVGISGASHHGLNPAIYAKESGLIEELRLNILNYRSEEGYGEAAILDAVFFDFIYNEKNIKLMMNTLVEECKTENGKIVSCTARHCVNNEKFEIVAEVYADATGNGVLAYSAGADFMIGREGKDEYGEFWAPERHDDFTMGNSLYFETEDMGHEVKFTPPAFAHDITKMEFLKYIDKPENFRGFSIYGPHWAYEFGGQLDILKDHDETESELRKLIYGIWDYVKNSGKYPQAKNMRLKRVFAKAGTRESRRFIGDYILTENDIENKVDFEDSVAIGGWPMDIHAPLGIYDKGPATNFVSVTGTYNIPFRSLYSRDIENLMLAGRDISATHIALGSTRVMATCGVIGQAVGTAAYLCKKYGVLPRKIANEHISELQNVLLSDDQTILHRYDSVFEGFFAEAQSEKIYENVEKADFMPLERDYALMLMCDSERLESLEIYLKGEGTLKFKVLHGTHKETFLPEREIKRDEIEVSGEGWVKIPINAEVGEDGKVYLVFCENSDIELGIGEKRVMGAVSARMHTQENHEGKNQDSVPLKKDTGYIYTDHVYERKRNILFKNILPKQNVFAAKNTVNGYARPYGTQNIWLPEKLPAAISFAAEKAEYCGAFELIFDTALDIDEKISKMHGTLAKNFDVKLYTDKGIKEFSCKDNIQRTVRFAVDAKLEKAEVTIKESYGENAGIYGIRIK